MMDFDPAKVMANIEKEKSAKLNSKYFEANRLFDKREQILLTKGFKRVIIKEYNLAIYVKNDVTHKPVVIQTSFMMFAPDDIFNNRIEGY